jgi:hypothetical protein
MCNFLSAIVLRNGDIVCDPEHTDSHEDLIAMAGLRDDRVAQAMEAFCRVELLPPDDHAAIADVSAWRFVVDEEAAPSWLDRAGIAKKLRRMVAKMLVGDTRRLLLGGCWILHGEARVSAVKNGRIALMHDSSQVGTMHDSSRVGTMHDSSRVEAMYGSSQVGAMYDSSRVGTMHDSSRVGTDLRAKKG